MNARLATGIFAEILCDQIFQYSHLFCTIYSSVRYLQHLHLIRNGIKRSKLINRKSTQIYNIQRITVILIGHVTGNHSQWKLFGMTSIDLFFSLFVRILVRLFHHHRPDLLHLSSPASCKNKIRSFIYLVQQSDLQSHRLLSNVLRQTTVFNYILYSLVKSLLVSIKLYL